MDAGTELCPSLLASEQFRFVIVESGSCCADGFYQRKKRQRRETDSCALGGFVSFEGSLVPCDEALKGCEANVDLAKGMDCPCGHFHRSICRIAGLVLLMLS